jgi:hypothetical protein
LPQPAVELSTDDWKQYRRVELGGVLPLGWPDDAVKRFGGYLSAQSRLPWNVYTWLGPGHTLPCDSWHDGPFTAALLVRDHPALEPVTEAELFGDPVSILWFLPITEAERQLAMTEGSATLLQRIPRDRWSRA